MGFVLSPPSILTSLSSIFIVDFWVFTFEWGNKIRIRKYVLVGLFQTHQFFVRFCFHCDANVRGQPQISHKVTNKLCVMRGRALSGAASWYFLAHNSEGSPVLYCPVRVDSGEQEELFIINAEHDKNSFFNHELKMILWLCFLEVVHQKSD